MMSKGPAANANAYVDSGSVGANSTCCPTCRATGAHDTEVQPVGSVSASAKCAFASGRSMHGNSADASAGTNSE